MSGSHCRLRFQQQGVCGDLSWLKLTEEISRYTPAEASASLDEHIPISFRTPYGCSKGAADQYILEYARTFSLRTVVFRHSTIYGGRQHSTIDQGWVSGSASAAHKARSNSFFHRQWKWKAGSEIFLHVSDAVLCYLSAHQQISKVAGNVFNIGGGLENSLSVLELLEILSKRTNTRLNVQHLGWTK